MTRPLHPPPPEAWERVAPSLEEVIFAGYDKEMTTLMSQNPGLASRFPTTITFEDYTASELLAIGDKMLRVRNGRTDHHHHLQL